VGESKDLYCRIPAGSSGCGVHSCKQEESLLPRVLQVSEGRGPSTARPLREAKPPLRSGWQWWAGCFKL